MLYSLDRIDVIFTAFVTLLEKVVFVTLGDIPVIILWIVTGGVFFTLRMGFINLRGFKHAVKIASTPPESSSDTEDGEVSSFQALATALSGSVGLGNIAGVAIAIQLGGPGAVFWMSVTGLLGMSIKFVECTLGMKYRSVNPDGTIVGGPMYYLSQGLAKLGLEKFGRFLALTFAIFGIPAALGGGNMFQSNQSFAAVATIIPAVKAYDWAFGLIMAFFVGLVILGGISRIGVVTSKVLPLMVTTYIVACFWIIGLNFEEIPHALQVILSQAFSIQGIEGGMIGGLVQGIRRSVFSNGAGIGAAAIAHSVARTNEPIREGILAILEPFIDTVVICNLTALVILTTGTYGDNVSDLTNGSALATAAFAKGIDWFPILLGIIIILFAFSTMITWSYYGERCWAYLLGEPSVFVFKGLFLVCIFIGSVVNLGVVVNFSDMMLLAMTLPNLLGCLFMSNQVATDLKHYWDKLSQERIG